MRISATLPATARRKPTAPVPPAKPVPVIGPLAARWLEQATSAFNRGVYREVMTFSNLALEAEPTNQAVQTARTALNGRLLVRANFAAEHGDHLTATHIYHLVNAESFEDLDFLGQLQTLHDHLFPAADPTRSIPSAPIAITPARKFQPVPERDELTPPPIVIRERSPDKDGFTPLELEFPPGVTNFVVDHVRYSLASDRITRARIEKGGTLVINRKSVEFIEPASQKKYAVKLDDDGYVLGTDGKVYKQHRTGNAVRLHRPKITGPLPVISLDFWEIALRRDAGIYAIANRVNLSNAGRLIAEGNIGQKIYKVMGTAPRGDRINLPIKREIIPLSNRTLHEYLYHHSVDLFIKEEDGQVTIAVHDHSNKRHIGSFKYDPAINRLTFARLNEKDGPEIDIVDAVRSDRSLGLYYPNCFLGEEAREGSLVYISKQKGQPPLVRNTDSQLLKMTEVDDGKNRTSYLFGEHVRVPIVRGWRENNKLLPCKGGYLIVVFLHQTYYVPTWFVKKHGLKAGCLVDIYIEEGLVSKFRYKGKVVALKSKRDQNGKLLEVATSFFTGGLLPDGPTFLENVNAVIHKGKLVVKMRGVEDGYLPLCSLGTGAKSLRARFFDSMFFSVVAQPDGQVVYWAARKTFSQEDQKLIGAILKHQASPAAFDSAQQGGRLIAEAQSLRSKQIDRHICRIVRQTGRRDKAKAASIRKYLANDDLTPLEVGFALQSIRQNTQASAHSLFTYLWEHIKQTAAEIPPAALYAALRQMWNRGDIVSRADLQYIIARLPKAALTAFEPRFLSTVRHYQPVA